MRHTCPAVVGAPRASTAGIPHAIADDDLGSDRLWESRSKRTLLSPRQVVAESDPATTTMSLCFQHMACMARPGRPAAS